ncbi:glycosyltransferase [Sinomonas sp. JGH33]|uniref:Glycosyltransferase n=1 Tax=Sinomonas terricola TaxID=3110330 RepID=A0ABU5TBX6_9MICC|nr:glycosyltransferase [Sinomonas sp. JGH33]MEA5456989.1 glycosyltransferase [Sinomonas sp. JGH33]
MTTPNKPLRIAHVVTLVSPDGAYGGPVRVAANQAKALIERGHEATLLGGCWGFDRLPETYDGVPARLFPVANIVPGSGFAGLFSRQLAMHLFRQARSFDVVHIHLARDLITLPAAWIARNRGVPYVAQTHGMIDASANILAKPLDRFLTRPLLGDAKTVLHLTPREASDLGEVVGGRRELRVQHLPNGVPPAASRTGVDNDAPDVLFLARLHPRKRPRSFVEAAQIVSEAFPRATFSIVGPDEGEEPAVRELALRFDPSGTRIRLEGAVSPDQSTERMRQSSIYVLPSANEPFPMSVLEAMAIGLPVIISEDCGLSDAVRSAGAGLVVDGSTRSVADAMLQLLGDADRRRSLGENARRLVFDRFSMPAIAEQLEEIYLEATMARATVRSIA